VFGTGKREGWPRKKHRGMTRRWQHRQSRGKWASGRATHRSQDERRDAFWMRLGVFESQGRAPRPAEYARPLLDPQVGSQRLDVGDEKGGLVGDGGPPRTRLAAASLVVEDHPVVIRIEEAGVSP